MSASAAQGVDAPPPSDDADAAPLTAAPTRRPFGLRVPVPGPLFTLAAALTGVWALFQNLYRISVPQVLADELTYSSVAWTYVHGQAKTPHYAGLTPAPDNFEHPPLAKLLFGAAQLVVGHAGITADRVVTSLCVLLAGVLFGVWVARIAGRWTGLLAFALLTVLPEAASGSVGRFDRFGMLDPVAELFMVASVVLGWEWFQRGGRKAWIFAGLSGVAVGCAAAAKENGFLGLVGPALLILGFAAVRDRSRLLARVGQTALAVAVCVITFVATYLPVAAPLASIKYLVQFQHAHSNDGHLIGFAGRVEMYPPWWANLWFAGHSWGSALTTVLVVTAAAAVLLRRDRVAAWLLAALAVPFVFHCFVTHVALGFYWVMWTPAFLALSALGVQALTQSAARLTSRRVVAVVVAVALLAVPVTAAADQTKLVARIKPIGVKNLGTVMRQNGLTGPVLTGGVQWWLMATYLPKTPLRTTVPNEAALNGVETVVIGAPQCNVLVDQSVRATVAVNVAAGRMREVYTDANMTVYARTGREALLAPTASQVAAQPAGRPTDNC